MKNTAIFISALVVAVSGFAAADEILQSFEKRIAPPLSISVEVVPVEYDRLQLLERPTPGKFRCKAFVESPPGSRQIVTTEDILLWPGEKGEKVVRHKDLRVTFAAEIGSDAKFARTGITVERGEEMIARQASHVILNRPAATVVPAEPGS